MLSTILIPSIRVVVVDIENRAGNDAKGPECTRIQLIRDTNRLAARCRNLVTEMMRAAVAQRLSALLPCKSLSNVDGHRM